MKLGQAFCDELIKNCLAPSVPNKSELLPTFSIEVVDHAHMLQQSLQEMGFLQPGSVTHALYSLVSKSFGDKLLNLRGG